MNYCFLTAISQVNLGEPIASEYCYIYHDLCCAVYHFQVRINDHLLSIYLKHVL